MKSEKIKNIAVVVAGTDEEYQNTIIKGINACAKDCNVNILCFAAFGGVIANSRYDLGEYNIYNLINYNKLDGIILMTNTICSPKDKKKIISSVKEAGIPAAVFDCDEYPEFYNISIDNTNAMREIVRHVIVEHNAKTINFISGPLSNPEACDRYDAFLEVMADHHLTSDERRIYFGEFRSGDGRKAIETFIKSGLTMPDAIICANDAMALTAINSLERHGYKVPEDIIVTGFDNTYNAQHFCPALTSVSRPLFDAGYQACKILLRVMDGEVCEKNTALSASPVFSESCGCVHQTGEDIRSYKKSTYKLIDEVRSDISLLNRMTSALAETETVDKVLDEIGRFMDEIECESCAICFCAEWQGAFKDSRAGLQPDALQVTGYTRSMSAPLIWHKGSKITSVKTFNSEDMFPEQLKGGGNISYFLPLHFRERCLGYYIICNGDFPIKSMLCHSIIMNMSNSVENIRKLLHLNHAINELDKLYVVDPLCGIYNRNGFIRAADSMFKKCMNEEKSVLICFIDMDGLKMINDNYGHNEGDFALQRLAGIISDCCSNGLICARFGGDEFIIFGADAHEEDAEILERHFEIRMAEINKILNKPYELAASVGTCVTKLEPDMLLFKLITEADEKMYEQKKKKKTSRYLRKT